MVQAPSWTVLWPRPAALNLTVSGFALLVLQLMIGAIFLTPIGGLEVSGGACTCNRKEAPLGLVLVIVIVLAALTTFSAGLWASKREYSHSFNVTRLNERSANMSYAHLGLEQMPLETTLGEALSQAASACRVTWTAMEDTGRSDRLGPDLYLSPCLYLGRACEPALYNIFTYWWLLQPHLWLLIPSAIYMLLAVSEMLMQCLCPSLLECHLCHRSWRYITGSKPEQRSRAVGRAVRWRNTQVKQRSRASSATNEPGAILTNHI